MANKEVSKDVIGRFDTSKDKKVAGVCVDLINESRMLFDPETAKWRWRLILGEKFLEIEERGEVVFHAPMDSVVSVCGPQVIFANANWKR